MVLPELGVLPLSHPPARWGYRRFPTAPRDQHRPCQPQRPSQIGRVRPPRGRSSRVKILAVLRGVASWGMHWPGKTRLVSGDNVHAQHAVGAIAPNSIEIARDSNQDVVALAVFSGTEDHQVARPDK